MTVTEHILLESDDRAVPDRLTARKIHAECVFRSRLRNRTLQLEIIDLYYLSVKIRRARAPALEYVLDLRFVDPTLHSSRHIAWRSIVAASTLAVTACVGLCSVNSLPQLWKLDWPLVSTGLFGLTASALLMCVYRTTETLSLRSTHGHARLLQFTGQIGMLKALRPFITKLGAHMRIAMAARRATRMEHLRDEMREHFRLKEIGVLADAEYEACKTRILAAHAAR